MKLIDKTILLISPEPWGHIFVSKHHYAVHLGKRGNKVFFLNPPSTENKIEQTDYANVWSVHYNGFPKGMRFYPSFLQRLITKSRFNALRKLCDSSFDIVWSFDNSVFYNFEALPKKVFCISHIVDLNQNFQTRKAAASADLCIGVIPQLVERLKKYNTNTHLITHGVQEFPDNLEAIELPGQNEIKALYAGNMTMPHIDWKVLYLTASNHSTVDFVFVGSNWNHVRNSFKLQLQQLNNVYALNAVSAEQLPGYLRSASILLLTYTPEYSNTYASPHKMMEYLGSGKVIVATQTPDYRDLADNFLISMTNNNDDFIEFFKDVLVNLSTWNSDDKKKLRISYALKNTYVKHVERIESIS